MIENKNAVKESEEMKIIRENARKVLKIIEESKEEKRKEKEEER